MKFILENIQSIVRAQYDFPEKGMVQILGGNSNGKSVLLKAIDLVARLKIYDNDERRSLIRDHCEAGKVIMSYQDKILYTYVHEDRDKCFMALQRDANDETTRITRTLREGGLEELVEEFGFCTYCKGAVNLQLSNMFDIIPFVNATPGMNGEIVEAMTTDTVAQQFLTNFKEITHKTAKEKKKNLDIKIESLKASEERLALYDYKTYEEKAAKMKVIYENMKYLNILEPLQMLEIPPSVKILNACCVPLKKLEIPEFIPVSKTVSNLSNMLDEIQQIKDGTCPLCGKPLLDCGGVK